MPEPDSKNSEWPEKLEIVQNPGSVGMSWATANVPGQPPIGPHRTRTYVPLQAIRERLRGVENALQQALMIVGEGLPGESERDSNMRIHAKWAVENALKDLAAFPEGDGQ